MKKIFASFALCICLLHGQGQSAIDTSITLDLLQAPASPAFNLLGISPSSIERPTDLNSFRLSVQNASNNFSKIPSNYAAEFAPASLFNVKNQTLTHFNSKKFSHVFWQSFSVSLGLTRTDRNDVEKDDSSSTTKLGIGFKFSIIRPHWTEATQKQIDSIYHYLDLSVNVRKKLFTNNEDIKRVEDSIRTVASSSLSENEKTRLILNLSARLTAIKKELLQNQTDLDKVNSTSLKELASELKIVRKGAFLDFATGMVFDFRNDRFDNSSIYKAGAWLTGGYEGGEQFSALAIARYLYQPDKIFADDSAKLKTDNISTFDAGARFIIGGGKKKFAASIEGLYRSVLKKQTIPSSWRLVFNASYDLGKNRMLTLGLGRNFDGAISKTGNLVAALNFIIGFGSSKSISRN